MPLDDYVVPNRASTRTETLRFQGTTSDGVEIYHGQSVPNPAMLKLAEPGNNPPAALHALHRRGDLQFYLNGSPIGPPVRVLEDEVNKRVRVRYRITPFPRSGVEVSAVNGRSLASHAWDQVDDSDLYDVQGLRDTELGEISFRSASLTVDELRELLGGAFPTFSKHFERRRDNGRIAVLSYEGEDERFLIPEGELAVVDASLEALLDGRVMRRDALPKSRLGKYLAAAGVTEIDREILDAQATFTLDGRTYVLIDPLAEVIAEHTGDAVDRYHSVSIRAAVLAYSGLQKAVNRESDLSFTTRAKLNVQARGGIHLETQHPYLRKPGDYALILEGEERRVDHTLSGKIDEHFDEHRAIPEAYWNRYLRDQGARPRDGDLDRLPSFVLNENVYALSDHLDMLSSNRGGTGLSPYRDGVAVPLDEDEITGAIQISDWYTQGERRAELFGAEEGPLVFAFHATRRLVPPGLGDQERAYKGRLGTRTRPFVRTHGRDKDGNPSTKFGRGINQYLTIDDANTLIKEMVDQGFGHPLE